MTLPIIHVGHPLLRERSKELSREELLSAEMQAFIDEMIETMRSAGGVGLAAVQVARAIRICVIEVSNNKRYPYMPQLPLRVLINPVLRPLGEACEINYEGCLSVPGIRAAVKRPLALRVSALDRSGQTVEIEYFGLAAVIVSHECDHMDGVLFVDRVAEPTSICTWEMYVAHKQAAETKKWTQIQSRTPVAEREVS